MLDFQGAIKELQIVPVKENVPSYFNKTKKIQDLQGLAFYATIRIRNAARKQQSSRWHCSSMEKYWTQVGSGLGRGG